MAKRPAHVKPPPYLAKNSPVPQPAPVKQLDAPSADDPTRFGDWTLKGIAVDF